ncbi:DUF3703 domain-containing protein [Rheinheimera texasensis]|uniref:DUF3703 domain-containing protein n=1 Tax=Rheinheimera texasensis TaxID=306205 RepID=UPI000A04372D|nr:DUF3703 domain-containing protein [Rheinheimera texasensis]
MSSTLKQTALAQLQQARQHYQAAEYQQAFAQLERAHLLGQRFLWLHLQTHWWMLKCGSRQQVAAEIRGQLLRLLAVLPAYLLGWVPLGNTGGANVSALRPMPIPPEFRPLFPRYPVLRDMTLRLLFALLLLGVSLLLPA